jgi:dipeptidyl-peptidase-4
MTATEQTDPTGPGGEASEPLSYPRENARTLGYSLGRPRSFTVSADGGQVLFLRSASGTERSGDLWALDLASGTERRIVSAATALGGNEELSAQERARRERMRESAAGIVAYSTDAATRTAVFALSGRLFVADLETDECREVTVQQPVVDPRIDPTGRRVAYASRGELRVVDLAPDDDRALLVPTHELEVWGLADFVAAEELSRSRGYWWSPDGESLLAERYDEAGVSVCWVSDPTHPERAPVPHRYPAAGTPNPTVTLWQVELSGERREVRWDHEDFEYVSAVHWDDRGEPLVQLLSRRQDRAQVVAVAADASTRVLREQTDPCWVDVVPGAPAWTTDGRLLTVEVAEGRYALCVDGEPVTPEDLQVRGVVGVEDTGVVVVASREPTEQHLWRWDGARTVALTHDRGWHTGTVGATTSVVVSATMDAPLPQATVVVGETRHSVASSAVVPSLVARPQLFTEGDLTVAVLLPSGHQAGTRLPVLLDPYGGPHGLQVLQSQGAFRESQWFADQGFAVVVCDGRGTPRDPAWERAVRHDLAEVVLADQVLALEAALARYPDLDSGRVAMRGWSFGGYLSALAVLRRPDVFHAAVAGAPVTDWRLYDTAYTERYLGLPQENPDSYERCSLLPLAPMLRRPLMLVHGLSDDNVLVANTLQLSGALMAAGRPHTVLPLSGVTHMTPQEEVAENLLLLQVEFLHRALVSPGERYGD